METLDDILVSIQPNPVGGITVYTASVWVTSTGTQALRYTVFDFDKNGQQINNGVYDYTGSSVKTTTLSQSLKIEDAYFDRMSDSFFVAGVIKGTTPLTSFYTRLRYK